MRILGRLKENTLRGEISASITSLVGGTRS